MNSRFVKIESRLLELELLTQLQRKEIEDLKSQIERKNVKRQRNTKHSNV